jgi:hypothetical protein
MKSMMRSMRPAALLAVVILAGSAAPALAQSPGFQRQMDANLRDSQLQALQDLAARQAQSQQNQLRAFEAQVRAEQAVARVQAQSYTPSVPPPPASGALPSIDVGAMASIPDDRLAASNARVREAAGDQP